MSRRGAFVRFGPRWSVLGLVAIIAIAALTTGADARTKRKPARSAYNPPEASIVVDANSGAVMQASNADARRHPASLTKIMTLYMLFERLEQGKLKLTSELPVSSHAAAQAPSKLGLKPGETIRVEHAIRAVVTKSANDIAVVIGEAIAGDEPSFARAMTAKARALGMSHTTYRNASGLPDDDQITTARDQALLARAMHDRFPQYSHYFAMRTFEWRGRSMRNHNHLLGRVAGVDGMKTGYIRASGFNIVTSARRNGRYIIAVVFGGRTGAARDAKVTALIENNIRVASTKRTAPPIGEAAAMVAKKEPAPLPSPAPHRDFPREPLPTPGAKQVAQARIPVPVSEPQREQLTEVAAAVSQEPSVGSTDPIKPNAVKTVSVQPGTMQTMSLASLPADNRKLVPSATNAKSSVTTIATVKGEVPPLPDSKPELVPTTTKVASAAANIPVSDSAKARASSGWMIQVGAFDDEKDAKNRLNVAQDKAKSILAKADPFTEKISKGEKSLYRARFAGLEKTQAENACKHLKRSEIPCIALKN